jgi:hypothetical protein
MALTTASIRLSVATVETSTLDLRTSTAKGAVNQLVELATGTSAGQANRIFMDTRTLAASATENIDLAGALTDSYGNAQVFARVKALIVVADSANTNNVEVTKLAAGAPVFWDGSAESAPEPGVSLRPGAFFCLACGDADATGYVVTATSADLITFTNSAGSTTVTYDLVVIGTSA